MWCWHICKHFLCAYSHPEATRLTTMEVEVDELWTSTVTKIPTTSPATGLDSTALSRKMSPATLPGWICRPHTHTNTHTHIHTQYWSQTWQLLRAMLNKAHGACSPQIQKGQRMKLCIKLYSTAPVGQSELLCGDSLICQTSTSWVTTSPLRGQRGWRHLPPANWKAELRVSREQTKKKRRVKRSGILDIFTRSCFIVFGLCGELSVEKQQQQHPGRWLASQRALNLERRVS